MLLFELLYTCVLYKILIFLLQNLYMTLSYTNVAYEISNFLLRTLVSGKTNFDSKQSPGSTLLYIILIDVPTILPSNNTQIVYQATIGLHVTHPKKTQQLKNLNAIFFRYVEQSFCGTMNLLSRYPYFVILSRKWKNDTL